MSSSTPSAPHMSAADSADELDLLDLLLLVANHLKLLAIAPFFIGLCVLLLCFGLPKRFESSSMLNAEKSGLSTTPSVIASLATSADLLDSVALELGIAKDASKAIRLKVITPLVAVSTSRQDKLITLRTLGLTPEKAQNLNTVLWKHLLPLTAPRGGERQRLKNLLDTEQAQLEQNNKLELNTVQQLKNGRFSDNLARLYGELLESNSKRVRAIAELQSRIEGLTEDDLVQKPTLPENVSKPRPVLNAFIATLVSAIVLLLFIFARHAWQTASQRPAQAEKIAQLRTALRWRRSR